MKAKNNMTLNNHRPKERNFLFDKSKNKLLCVYRWNGHWAHIVWSEIWINGHVLIDSFFRAGAIFIATNQFQFPFDDDKSKRERKMKSIEVKGDTLLTYVCM